MRSGRAHLESICDRIVHQYGIELDLGEPTVIYLETIRKTGEAEGKYIRQTGGAGNYAHVKIASSRMSQARASSLSTKLKVAWSQRYISSLSRWRSVRRCRAELLPATNSWT